jgi:hypothetical protein
VDVLFERIAFGYSLNGWNVVGAPRESLRDEPHSQDVLLTRLPTRTRVHRVVRTRGEWLLCENDEGRRWMRVLENGRLREHFAIARRVANGLREQQATPVVLPVLDKNTRVTLPAEADLPTLRTALRLEAIAASTRRFLDVLVALAKTHPGATLMQDLKRARDDLASATSTKTVDKLLQSAAAYEEVVSVAALTGTAQMSPSDAMARLVSAREAIAQLLERKAAAQQVVTELKGSRKKLAKVSAQLVSRADEARTLTTQLIAWLVAIKKSKEWSSSLRKFVDQKRPGGTLDRTHLQRAKVDSRELTPGALPRFSEWDLLGAGDLLDRTLASKVTKARQKLTLTAPIKAAFSAAFTSAQSSSPTNKMLDACADAIIAAVPSLTGDRAALRDVARDLIIKVAGDRGSATAAAALARVTTALDTESTKAFAQDLLEAAKLWPFEASHFLDRTLRVFAGFAPGFDIFDQIGNHLVTYNFFGQDPIVINDALVPQLTTAERHYFGLRAQFPVPPLQIARETGAFNFRLARAKVMRKLLLKSAKGFYVHTVGRAIDVNYPDERNPHVTAPREIWLVVKATLAFAATQAQDPSERTRLERLAAIDFGQSQKQEDILYDILAASREFVLGFAAFDAAAPRGFLAPQTSWPKVKEYEAALAAIGRDKRSAAVKSAIKQRDAAVETEKKARRKLLDAATQTLKAWRQDLKTLGTRLQAYLDDEKSASQLSHMRAILNINKQLGPLQGPMQDIANERKASARLLQLGEHARRVTLAAGLVARDVTQQADARGITIGDLKTARTRSRWRTEQEYYEGVVALLPTDGAAVTTAQAAHDTAIAATDAAKADAVLVAYQQGQRELALIAARRKYDRFYTRWSQQGFVDHDPMFLWAMKRGEFTWGGEFGEPDLHHFEFKDGLDWSANW